MYFKKWWISKWKMWESSMANGLHSSPGLRFWAVRQLTQLNMYHSHPPRALSCRFSVIFQISGHQHNYCTLLRQYNGGCVFSKGHWTAELFFLFPMQPKISEICLNMPKWAKGTETKTKLNALLCILLRLGQPYASQGVCGAIYLCASP